ncbi:undecaprenyl-phosphate alpha-N-acetylglucosaminyl 1-phosphate transferase [Planotetraspora thailandica]|uniref:Undecaprenyl-phosphate alpha-N-acetylglucosaminyl 1-phosphate transferase n=1 Tax=Planotetraspora thailandica TaxID=487172 RepID=A0A8J3V600_9ACTN|nr:MraY family glycosyltransferase [Planotetraspora thailandica]GII54644.1 undecaprenyl-phosphate alpha-N-acetylglucosaminyl 1-phosphate transferase [Planotetraspora thailandica]
MTAALALAAGVAGFLLTAGLMGPLRRLAVRWDLTDRSQSRHVRARPIAFLGGFAIVLGTLLPVLAVLGVSDRRVTAILVAAVAVAFLGLVDDVRPLPVATRLIAESLAAGLVVASGVQITFTGQWMDGPVTVMWIVVITNSFNLLDNMDGALGGVTVVTAVVLVGSALVGAQAPLAMLVFALACAALGFLTHNWAPARMHMGGSGSLFIGFVLTCSSIALVTGAGPDTICAGLLLPAFVAVVDTGVVLVSRLLAGRPLLIGGADHVSHRLRRAGIGARGVASALTVAAAVSGSLGLTVALGWASPLTVAAVAGSTAVILIGVMQGVDVYAPARPVSDLAQLTRRRW